MTAAKTKISQADDMLLRAIREKRAVRRTIPIRDLMGKGGPDRTYQTRVNGEDVDHVRYLDRLIEIGTELFPIVVVRDPETGRWQVVNGFHRLKAHLNRQLAEIAAWVVDWSPAEAWTYAVGCNLVTALPTTQLDRKNALVKFLEVNHTRSVSSLAKLCGVSHHTVKNTLIEFCMARKIPVPRALVGLDDRIRIITPEPPKPTPLRTDPRLADDRRELPSPARGTTAHDRKTCPMCNGSGTVPA